MKEFFTLRWAPTFETARATGLVVAYLLVMFVMLKLEATSETVLPGVIITGFYFLMFVIALIFIFRRGLASAGITAGRWPWGAGGGLLLGALGLSGTAECFPAGTFAIPPWPSLLSLIAAGLSLGFIEVLVIYGYFQFRLEEAFGALPAVIGSTAAWTLAHGAALAVPGAGTFATACVGPRTFLFSLFVSFFVLGLVVHFTRNIWAGVAQNAVMANVVTSLYMFSIAPDQVFIAKPSTLPAALFLASAVATGLLVCQRRGAA